MLHSKDRTFHYGLFEWKVAYHPGVGISSVAGLSSTGCWKATCPPGVQEITSRYDGKIPPSMFFRTTGQPPNVLEVAFNKEWNNVTLLWGPKRVQWLINGVSAGLETQPAKIPTVPMKVILVQEQDRSLEGAGWASVMLFFDHFGARNFTAAEKEIFG